MHESTHFYIYQAAGIEITASKDSATVVYIRVVMETVY
jgi:hypothetical protein